MTDRRPSAVVVIAASLTTIAAGIASAAGDIDDYHVGDPGLAVSLIDSSETESFLGVHFDSEGRLFAGGREAVFVYEPDGRGGFGPRIELFRFPPDSWVYDIAVRGNDLYVQTVTTLFVLPGAQLRREGITARPLVWGIPAGSAGGATYGVHQGMHGLAWGPDGDLRISFGDCVWSGGALPLPTRIGHCLLSTGAGERVPLNGTGGILRVGPDGSRPRLVAGGLRNPCGLAYDHDWNLFTHDNDHESLPVQFVPGRLLHVTGGADFSWPRGWAPTKTPERRDLLETMVDDLGRTIPVGQACYDEPLLGQACGDTILLARWCQSTLSAFPTEPHGATFKAREKILLQGKNFMRPVGVAVSPDGRIVIATCGMRGNETSPVYPSDLLVISARDAAPDLDRCTNVGGAKLQDLLALLAGDSWKLRQAAHAEVLRRGAEAGDLTVGRLREEAARAAGNPQLIGHLVYLAAAAASPPWDLLETLTRHADAGVRLQAVRSIAAGAPASVPAATFVAALADPSPPVQLAALEALFSYAEVPAEVVAGPARSRDTYLRQTASRLIAEKASVARLGEMLSADDSATRLAAVLALGRRLTTPPEDFVPPPDWQLGSVLGPKIHHEGRIVDLTQEGRIGSFTLPLYWAHTRAGRAVEFDLLARALADGDAAVGRQAAYFLSLLDDPRTSARAAAILAPAAMPPPEPAAEPAADPTLAGRLSAAGSVGGEGHEALLAIDWSRAGSGDAANGRRLFTSIGCGKCHAVSLDTEIAGGPSLVGVGKRYAPEYIAESVILPSKHIAELFRGTTVITEDGRVVSGLVVRETEQEIELMLADATHRKIAKSAIEERSESKVSPMPAGLVQTAAELHDILAYLTGPDVN